MNPKLADIENALLEVIRTDAAILVYKTKVETLGDEDVNDKLGLISPSRSFLLLFESSSLAAADKITRQTYDYRLQFRIFMVARSLRSPGAEKKGGVGESEVGAYKMLDDLKTALAGARLSLAGSGLSSNPQVELLGEQLESFGRDGTVMSLQVQVNTGFQR